MRRHVLTPFLALPLLAQAAPKFDEAFFNGDKKAVLVGCAQQAQSMKPKDAKWLAEYGRAYLAAGDQAKARACFKEAEARESNDGQVLRLIALGWLKNGFKNEALETYEKILARDPKNKEALVDSAVDLASVVMPQYADRFMEQYLKLEKDDWEKFLIFGKAYLNSGLREKAARWFAKAVAAKPGEEKVYLEISKAYADSQALM
jgi:tetratricopeptide (TPR) repeat protein